MGAAGEVKVGRRTRQSKAETLITLPIWSSRLLWGLPEASGTLVSSREVFGAVVCAVTALPLGRAVSRRTSWTWSSGWTKAELSPQVPGSVSSSFNRENPQQCPGSPSTFQCPASCSLLGERSAPRVPARCTLSPRPGELHPPTLEGARGAYFHPGLPGPHNQHGGLRTRSPASRWTCPVQHEGCEG